LEAHQAQETLEMRVQDLTEQLASTRADLANKSRGLAEEEAAALKAELNDALEQLAVVLNREAGTQGQLKQSLADLEALEQQVCVCVCVCVC
jgi:ribosome recycling factor